MADERLRELERSWRASGLLTEHVALLRERVRAGQLELGVAGLAAHLGHPAARSLLAPYGPEEADRSGWPQGWDELSTRLLEGGYEQDRVWFPGNPWPAGHGLSELMWSGRLEPERGLWFDLHVESVAYDSDDVDHGGDEGDDDGRDWQAKIVWGNYDHCRLSSSAWSDDRGFQIGSADEPLDFERLGGRVLRVDEEPGDPDERAFGVYLLGHDGVADHRILFTPRDGGRHRLEWSGRTALEYVGDTEFAYRFFLRASAVPFRGFRVPPGLRERAARAAFDPLVTDPERYRLARRAGARWFVRA